jgi:hypothetical protein
VPRADLGLVRASITVAEIPRVVGGAGVWPGPAEVRERPLFEPGGDLLEPGPSNGGCAHAGEPPGVEVIGQSFGFDGLAPEPRERTIRGGARCGTGGQRDRGPRREAPTVTTLDTGDRYFLLDGGTFRIRLGAIRV